MCAAGQYDRQVLQALFGDTVVVNTITTHKLVQNMNCILLCRILVMKQDATDRHIMLQRNGRRRAEWDSGAKSRAGLGLSCH